MNDNYRKKMISILTKVAEGLAELAGLLNCTAAEESVQEPEAAQTKKAPGRNRKAKNEETDRGAAETESTGNESRIKDDDSTAAPSSDIASPGTEEPSPRSSYTFEEARAVLAEKARSGFRAEVKALLAKRNVEQLSDITDPAELTALVMEAEQIQA